MPAAGCLPPGGWSSHMTARRTVQTAGPAQHTPLGIRWATPAPTQKDPKDRPPGRGASYGGTNRVQCHWRESTGGAGTGSGRGTERNSEFHFGKMKRFWKWVVVMEEKEVSPNLTLRDGTLAGVGGGVEAWKLPSPCPPVDLNCSKKRTSFRNGSNGRFLKSTYHHFF